MREIVSRNYQMSDNSSGFAGNYSTLEHYPKSTSRLKRRALVR